MSKAATIRPAELADSEAIADIYNWYIENTTISFEEQEVTAKEMESRMCFDDDTQPWLVMEEAGEVIGFASAALWKPRSAYRFSREVSIYLKPGATGQSYGRQLYTRLMDLMRETPIHLLIAGIALPNPASIKLHESLGFTSVGTFKEMGFKFGERLDVGYWQLEL
ncbi:MAG: GNAT family N-acetyltransferase [Pseudohongiellaceae bacterium]